MNASLLSRLALRNLALRHWALLIIILLAPVLCSPGVTAQVPEKIRKIGTFKSKGKVIDIQPGEITIANATGKELTFMIQDADERAISLDGNDYIVSMPCKIDVFGSLPSELLERGMLTKFQCTMNRFGKPGTEIGSIRVIQGDANSLNVTMTPEPDGDSFSDCQVVGRVVTNRRGKIYLEVPKSRIAPQQRMTFKLAEDSSFSIQSNNLNRVRPGDKVIEFAGQEMSNGAMVVREIKIEMTAKREKATLTFSDQLFQRYGNLSDEPGSPRTEESDYFVLHTDLSPRSSRVLLAKLDHMFDLLRKYYAGYPRKRIECYVVRDLENFPGKLNPMGIAKISEGAGGNALSRLYLDATQPGRQR